MVIQELDLCIIVSAVSMIKRGQDMKEGERTSV